MINLLFTPGSSLKGAANFFVKNGLKFLARKELDVSVVDDINEYQDKWIEIIQTNSKNIIVGVFYRHPRRKSEDSFCTYIANTLGKVNKKNTLTFVVGDFNYDLLKIENDKLSA